MILLWILMYFLLFLSVLFLLILLIPFEYVLSGSREKNYVVYGKILWLFGMIAIEGGQNQKKKVYFEIKVLGLTFKRAFSTESQTSTKKQEKKGKVQREEVREKKKRKWKRLIDLEILERAFHFLKNCWTHVAPRECEWLGSFGFEDPYYTGICCSLIPIFQPLFNNYHIVLTPRFDKVGFEGKFKLTGKIILIIPIYELLKLCLFKPVRNILFTNKEEKSYVH
ncbi:MAG: DUF2953 domain-containing protein [Thermotaleaceae bacterium]